MTDDKVENIMKKQSVKQPLRETLIKIGGGYLLKEQSRSMIMNYSDHLGAYLEQLRPNIRGWKFQVDNMAGSWEWYNRKFEDIIYATWGWEGRHEIPLETSDGDAFKAAKCKLTVGDPENEKEMKVNAKKYSKRRKGRISKTRKDEDESKWWKT